MKLALDLVLDIDDSAPRALTQNLGMKDVPGENVGVIVSYLKGALLLLGNCGKLPTDVIGLFNDTFYSAQCEDFTDYIKAIHFAHKRRLEVMDPMKFLGIAEAEYRSLYRYGKWDASKSDPGSAFFVEESGAAIASEEITAEEAEYRRKYRPGER